MLEESRLSTWVRAEPEASWSPLVSRSCQKVELVLVDLGKTAPPLPSWYNRSLEPPPCRQTPQVLQGEKQTLSGESWQPSDPSWNQPPARPTMTSSQPLKVSSRCGCLALIPGRRISTHSSMGPPVTLDISSALASPGMPSLARPRPDSSLGRSREMRPQRVPSMSNMTASTTVVSLSHVGERVSA